MSSGTAVVAALESMGGRYTCTHPIAQFTLFEYGRPLQPVRTRSLTSDGDVHGWWLAHPDWDEGHAEFYTQGLARQDAWGRPTGVGGTTITRESRIVYSAQGRKLPVTTAALTTDYFNRATGPAVLIGTTAYLIDDLWERAWGRGNEAQRGYSNQPDDDDGDYRPARPSSDRPRRRPRLRPAAPTDPDPGPEPRVRAGWAVRHQGHAGTWGTRVVLAAG